MWLLAVLAATIAAFGILVWFATGIARVEQHRADIDHHMIAAITRLEHDEGEP